MKVKGKFDKETEFKIRAYCADYEYHKEQIDAALAESLPEDIRKPMLDDIINSRGYYHSELANLMCELTYRAHKKAFKNALCARIGIGGAL